MFINSAFAQEAAAQAPNAFMSFVPFILIFFLL